MGKTMSIVMKNKLTATALAVTTVVGMGYSALASAGSTDSVQFSTEINVNSVNTCMSTTSDGGTVSWNLKWKLDAAGQTANAGTLDYNGATTEPLEVKVAVNDGQAATCKLNGMSIAADMMGSAVAEPGSAAYKVATSDGFWRYMPVVASVKLFTDNKFTTAATGDVTIAAADTKSYLMTQGGSSTHTGQTAITPDAGLKWGSNDAVVLSDGYLNNGGYAPLTFNGTTPDVKWAKSGTAEDIESVVVGVSSVIATNPEKADGEVYVDAVYDTEPVHMPFTVNVTYY